MVSRRKSTKILLILCLVFTVPVYAEPLVTTTTPIDGDPFKDVRVSGCENTRALALMQYDSLAGPFVISDFCINEETGEVLGPETVSGFELVSDSRAGKKFDIPATRNQRYQPTNFTLGRNDPRNHCGVEGMRPFDYLLSKQPLTQYSEFEFAYATGFTYSNMGSAPVNIEGAEAGFWFTNFNQYGIDGPSVGRIGLPTGLGAYGNFDASDRAGTIKIVEGDGYKVGDALGEFVVRIDDAGEVTLSGNFEVRSLDENGQDTLKWVSIKGDVQYFRGYIFGEPAAIIRGYGLASGTFETVTGEVYPFRSDVQLWTCFE